MKRSPVKWTLASNVCKVEREREIERRVCLHKDANLMECASVSGVGWNVRKP